MTDKNKPALSLDNSDELDLGRLFGTLVDNKWLILSIALFFAVASVIYTIFSSPVYRADALIQVEQTPQSSILGGLSSILPDAPPASDTEIEIIKSRKVVGKTIDDLNLDILVQKHYFPIFGKGYAHLVGSDNSENSGIEVSNFEVKKLDLNKKFTLEVLDNQHYKFSDANKLLFEGKVGEVNSKQDITIFVRKINAEKGTVFNLVKLPYLATYNNIINTLVVADKGKDTGVLGLSFDNEDPITASKILNSISQNYLLQNVERKTEEAQKSLDFIRQQLPGVKAALDVSENKLNGFRQNNDSVDLSLEAKSVLDTIVQLDAQLNELTFKETDISKLYTKDHPAYKSLIEKRQVLEEEKASLNKKVSSLPKIQQQILSLTRDVQVGQQVYMQLLNKQQELSITKASTVGNVRIVDPALTRLSPVQPKKMIIIGLGTFLGIIIAVAYSLLMKAMHKGIEGPEILETNGINVYASVPLSDWQKAIDSKLKGPNKNKEPIEILSLGHPTDLAVETIRSLRTSLHFAMMEAKNKVLMISGASPGTGKSFISSNLAVVLAQVGQRVLLIDADMRKGYQHEIFSIREKNIGLSNFLSGQIAYEDTIKSVDHVPGMSIIPRGQIPPNPSELLMNKRFLDLIEKVNHQYDIIIVDTPPILAVTDAAIIGQYCGTTLLVARFEENTVKQVEVSFRRFEQAGTEIKGVILNAIVKRASSQYSGEGYGYYQYEYSSKKE